MTPHKVGYLVGSLARGSINRKLAKALAKLAPASLELREIPIRDAHRLIPTTPTLTPSMNPIDEEPHPTPLYDTALTAEEGLWTRSGWAGRH